MATQISNVVTPAQAALNGKLYGGPAFKSQVPPPAPQTSFDAGASKLFGDIGGAIKGGINAIGGVKFGQQPAPSTGPFGAISPALQASANTAQGVPPAAPAAGVIPASNTTATNTGGVAGTVVNPNITSATPPAPPAATTAAPAPVTFPGLVGGLAGAGQQAVATGSAQEQEAFQKAQALQQQLAGSQGNEALTLANMQGNAIPIEFQQGRGNIVQNLYQQQQNALAQELAGQAALAGQGTAVQGQGIGALGTAAGAVAPQLGGIGTQQYYQPLQAGQEGAANQYGVGPAAAANVASIQSHTQNINDWSAARQSAANIGGQLSSFLQQNQINPSDFNAVNKFLQNIGAQTSSPQYKQFYNLVTDLANTYAPVLGQGDASNYKVQLAQSLLDGTANGQTIPQILQGLDNQAQAKIQGEQETVQRLQTGQNPNPAASTTNVGGAPSVSGFGWNG